MDHRSSVARVQVLLAASGFFVNFFWEMAQSPLYTDVQRKPFVEIFTARLHCTLGDVAILLGAYWLVALAVRDRVWLLRGRARDIAAVAALGLGYTVVSEWVNVDLRSAWGYTDAMPRVPWLGTGLAPFMQWVLAPPLIAGVTRRLAR